MLGRTTRHARTAVALAAALTMAAPAAAQAATKPAVTTGGAANITQDAVRLTGKVDPNGASTQYQFQYGTTKAYGSVTAAQTLTGDGAKTVTADVGALAPATKYHFRLIASNGKGQTLGGDRSFKTKRQPLGIVFAGNPNPVLFGGGTTLAGQVTGTGNGGREVVLQSNPFPYTQGFQNLGNAQIADAAGSFAFPLLSVGFNTQYRVVLPDRPSVPSPIVTVSVMPTVATKVGTYRVHKGSLLTFSGTIKPAADGTLMAVQRKSSTGRWITVGGMAARHSNSKQSKFKRRVRIHSTGTYRVYAGLNNGKYVPNSGREIRIRVKR